MFGHEFSTPNLDTNRSATSCTNWSCTQSLLTVDWLLYVLPVALEVIDDLVCYLQVV